MARNDMHLFQVAHDPRCSKSGVYWSWNGGPREGRGEEALERDGQIQGGGGAGGGWDSIYENDQSDKVLNKDTASDLFQFSSIVTVRRYIPLHAVTSPATHVPLLTRPPPSLPTPHRALSGRPPTSRRHRTLSSKSWRK